MTVELWSTERIRQELGAKTIRSAGRIILRLGLTPVSREPGRSGMNLYDATVARPVIAEHLARRGADGANLGQNVNNAQHDATSLGGVEPADDQREQHDVTRSSTTQH